MKILKDKKGVTDSFLLSFWFYFALGVIAIGIIIGVLIFYSRFIDIREEESKTISEKIINVIAEKGYLKEEILKEDFDLINTAGLNKDLFYNPGDFYINLTIMEGERVIKSKDYGNRDFEVQCSIPGDKLAICYKKEFVVLNQSNPGQKFLVKILSGSNQRGAEV